MHKLLKQIATLLKIDVLLAKCFELGLSKYSESKPYWIKEQILENKSYQSQKLLRQIYTKGIGVKLNGDIVVSHPRCINLGNNIHVGDNCYFFSRAGLTIGDNTHLSRNITIYTSNHDFKGELLPYSSDHIDKPVVIGNNVWIGMNVNILPGITIGDGAIIGMGATVAKNIASGEIVVSQPHRVVGKRDEKQYEKKATNQQFGGGNGKRLSEQELSKFATNLTDKRCSPFFVLSTGRAGSTTIAKLLSQHPEVTCTHEPKFSLVRLSTEYLHGEKTSSEAKAELTSLYSHLNCYPTGIYGESDQKLSNMVSLLAELYPNAKFIWLIRSPEYAVNSTWSRGWFSDEELGFSDTDKLENPLYRDIFSDYRPQADKANEMSSEEWKKMSSFERNCWYWTFWNSTIQNQLMNIDSSRWIKIRLEELEQSTESILDFVGAKKTPIVQVVTNKAESRYTLASRKDWSDKMAREFNKWCENEKLY
ncbi:sulfotransferase [Thalassotalea atypica]|uniref:sulfotransferase n=1 Tax=Thalassotalea atypica TaxID=2054316 RepID=UPI0025726985|nr:sulfotransferase [Thalassotalea atypica]